MGSLGVDRAFIDRIDATARGIERVIVLIGRKRSRLFLPVPLLLIVFAEPSTGSIGYGWALVILGSLWRLWSAGYLVKNTELITAGPYALIRHPLYFGMGLVITGWATLSGWSWVSAGLWLYSALLYGCAIFTEERRLSRIHPEYAWYRQSVSALFPSPKRFAGVRYGHFDWRNLARNGEWRVLAYNLAVALLIALRSGWLPLA